MDKTTITFVGCSFTVGVGLDLEKDDPGNYTNIIKTDFDSTIKNIAKGGNSNYNIFISALNELADNPPDYLVVQWTALNRLWLYPGPDTELYIGYTVEQDYNYRSLYFSKENLQNFSDMFHLLNHDYKNILTLVDYCKLINKMSNGTKVVYVNGLLPWSRDMFDKKSIENPHSNFSDYNKSILDFDTRDDDELQILFTRLTDKLMELDESQWVNLNESMMAMQADFGSDRMHPGYKSHKTYAETIISYLRAHYD